ncbi:MAG: cytochrome C oxidase subunit IV family protein [Candidatus Saccharimonadales bacterium]
MSNHAFSSILLRYIFGFGAALCLSAAGYLLATEKWLEGKGAMAVLLALAVLQLTIQLICFLHLGLRDRSRSRTATFIFVFIMAAIIVVGSIWIMNNLDYRMSTSSEAMNEYMQLQNKKGF